MFFLFIVFGHKKIDYKIVIVTKKNDAQPEGFINPILIECARLRGLFIDSNTHHKA